MHKRRTASTTSGRPAGMQAMGTAIYEQIRKLVQELASVQPRPAS